MRIGIVCLVLSSIQVLASTTITPTTTLAAETGNNTSAASSFQAQTNGNITPGNVSKVPTNSLLYSGSTTTVYAHFMPWFGVSYHMNVGYNSADPAQVKAQVTDMLSRGIAAALIDWYGPTATQENSSSLAVMNEAQTRNGTFHFAIVEDAGSLTLKNCANTSGCDITAALISDLNYITTTFIASPAYLTWNGNPVVFYFGVESYNIDWTRVRANTASNLIFVFQNSGGFTESFSNGAFSWVMPSDVTATDPMSLSYLSNFYSVAEQNPAKWPVGASYKGFNDSLASWGSKRYMEQACGQTWLSTFTQANSQWSTSHQLPWFQVVTWNDYEEGTEIETGIDNCVSVSASMSGSTLNWSITGSESTIDHYTAFISADGQNLMFLDNYPAGVHSADLSTFGFNAGSYTVFVKAVGKPSFLNHMSAAVTYVADPANGPVVALTATPTSGVAPVTVSASTANSTDASGTITSSTINFGDGTVVTGSAASHSYANAGTYTLKATLTDNTGLTASQSLQIVVTNPQPPVAAVAINPGSGTVPLTVTASTANSTDPQGSALSSTINFGDGTSAAGPTASHIYSNSGTYTVTATVTNGYRLQSQATGTVTVNGTAAVTVSQPANNATVSSPIPVVASGTAPSGVAAMQIYLDGTLVYQVSASSFSATVPASTGTHRITVKLWDNLGNAYSQTLYVTVATQFATSLSVTPTSVTTGASVSATVTATSGTMSSSQINWGDGTSSAGPSTSHVYSNAGTFNVTSTATSSTGTTAQSTASVTVTAPTASITVSQPANNSTVNSPIPVVAGGTSPNGVKTMQIYLDGTLVYQVNASSFSTTVSASPGTHLLVVKLWDNLGNAFMQSLNITVAAQLVTSLSIAPTSITAGGSVSATVIATSGTMASSQISWGDGSTSSGPTASHIYSTAGSFTVSSTATSSTGTTAKSAATVTVSSPPTTVAGVTVSLPLNNSTVSGPIHVVASGTAPSGVAATQIYLDGALVYQVNAASFDTTVAASTGTHHITVKLWDNLGNAYSQALTVTVGGSTDSLTVASPTNNATVTGSIHVVASGYAPTGIAAMQIYLDGTLVYQVNASSFDTTVAASTGTHSLTVKLWDNNGNAYKQSLTVTVQ